MTLKRVDKLAVDFVAELENEWRVDTRNFVYADERNPLDIYRTILRIDDERKTSFPKLWRLRCDSFTSGEQILCNRGIDGCIGKAISAGLCRSVGVIMFHGLD